MFIVGSDCWVGVQAWKEGPHHSLWLTSAKKRGGTNNEEGVLFGIGNGITGLGLVIAREIVRAQGGDIEATNASGGGAEFIVRLPINEVA